MKRCPECNVIYENNHDVCPTYEELLEDFAGTRASGTPMQNKSRCRGAMTLRKR